MALLLAGIAMVGAVTAILHDTSSVDNSGSPAHGNYYATTSPTTTSSSTKTANQTPSINEKEPPKSATSATTTSGTINTEEGVVTATGTITAIDASEMVVDGPMRITLRANDQTIDIAVPARESTICEATITDLFSLSQGEHIAIRGKQNADSVVVPCESNDHYVRKVSY